jgi:hypothetical protein
MKEGYTGRKDAYDTQLTPHLFKGVVIGNDIE